MDAKLYEEGLLFRWPTHLEDTTTNLWGTENIWSIQMPGIEDALALFSSPFPSGLSPWGDSIFSFRMQPVQTPSVLQKINVIAQTCLCEAKWELQALDLQCAQVPRVG